MGKRGSSNFRWRIFSKQVSGNQKIHESYHKISEFLRKREESLTGVSIDETFRNYAGISLQTARVRCLDPETESSGMQGTKLQKEIVNEYLHDPNSILTETERIYRKYDKRHYDKILQRKCKNIL
jgi:hypothetical protein